jgi:hypothetical protein
MLVLNRFVVFTTLGAYLNFLTSRRERQDALTTILQLDFGSTMVMSWRSVGNAGGVAVSALWPL